MIKIIILFGYNDFFIYLSSQTGLPLSILHHGISILNFTPIFTEYKEVKYFERNQYQDDIDLVFNLHFREDKTILDHQLY